MHSIALDRQKPNTKSWHKLPTVSQRIGAQRGELREKREHDECDQSIDKATGRVFRNRRHSTPVSSSFKHQCTSKGADPVRTYYVA